MHSLFDAQLAATLAAVGSPMIRQKAIPNAIASQEFWLNSRYRFELWNRQLADHRAAVDRPGTSHRTRKWYEVLPVLQEILLSEPVTRCLAYIGRAFDARRIETDFSALAQSTFSSQLESRHRCLNLIAFGHGLPVEQAVRLNRLRRTMETFSDQLIACLPAAGEMAAFAFEYEIVKQMQSRLRDHDFEVNQVALHLQSLSIALIRQLRFELDPRVVNARLNGKLYEIILALLASELFDSFGLVKSASVAQSSMPSLESDGNTADLSQPLESPLDTLLKPADNLRAKGNRSKHGRI